MEESGLALVLEAEADVVYKLNGDNSVMQEDVLNTVAFGINI
jgi:hypothetical protein